MPITVQQSLVVDVIKQHPGAQKIDRAVIANVPGKHFPRSSKWQSKRSTTQAHPSSTLRGTSSPSGQEAQGAVLMGFAVVSQKVQTAVAEEQSPIDFSDMAEIDKLEVISSRGPSPMTTKTS